ncbi:MAG: EAL domain-containing protein [Gammaproteobacteria bacterium]|nr:EAL domain-containing protein [Gammaproteobacteria bacterium]
MLKQQVNAGLVIGFTVALMLMALIFTVGLTSMSAIQNRLKGIAENQNVKTELTTSMRYAARERMLSLYRMLLLDDPFERDEEYLAFNRFALVFMTARNKLQEMPLSEEEQRILKEQGELTGVAVQLQERVIDFVYKDELAKAKQLLSDKTMEAQEAVFRKLNDLAQIQRAATEKAVEKSTSEYNRTRNLMYIFGIAAFVIVLLVALIVIRRTASSEAGLFRQKEKLQVTLNSIGDGVITTDACGMIDYINQAAAQLTGVSNEKSRGRNLFDVLTLVNDEGIPPGVNPVLKAIDEQRIVDDYEPMTLVRENGEHYAVELTAAPIKDYDGSIIGAVLVFRNMTAIRDMANQMAYQATHDSLTGLINRVEFERRLVEAINVSRNNNEEHVLCYMDLDQFKVVNDTCGHIAGDELLKQLTVLLHRKIRKSDTLGRLGGDEFGILFLDCTLNKAKQIIRVLCNTINEFRFVWGDKSFEVGVSVGVVAINQEAGGLSEVLSAADAACFVAKDLGRNRIHIYQPDDQLLSQRRGEMQWLPRIRNALEHDRFQLYYQKFVPVSNPDSEHNIELLVRMIDENEEIIPPMAFLPAAERYDLMPSIDRWVINNAFMNLKYYQVDNVNSNFMWTINISGQSLGDEYFLDFIIGKRLEHQIDSSRICFEITETAAVANLTEATHLITALKEEGFRFALDDFGSGLSSFNYLKHLPVDYLKIDGSFVKDLMDDPIDYAMVESINQIGHILKLKTIAEFVENSETLQILKELKVDYAQGYAIHKPQLLNFEKSQKVVQL